MTMVHKSIVAVAGLFSLLPVVAFAITPEIVTTAARTEGNLQEVPIAVTAIGMDDIQNLQINTGQDLQRLVPSLNMFNNITSPTNLSPSLRGGLQQDASIVTAESPFGIYIDDIYVGRLNVNNVTLSDIERIEVLRGPQGTLYGRNTGYGAIKYISRTPGDEFWFDASLGAGTDSQFNTQASVGGPLNDDWSASFAGQSRYKSGQYYNVAENTEVDKRRDYAARGKLRYTGGERLDAVLTISYTDSENDAGPLLNGIIDRNGDGFADSIPPDTPGVPDQPGVGQFQVEELIFPFGEYNVSSPFGQQVPPPLRDRPQSETDQTIAGLSLTYDINDNLTFKSSTGYVSTDYYTHTDFSGNGSILFGSTVDTDQWSQEFLLLGDSGSWNYTLGAFYLNEESDQDLGFLFFAPLSESTIASETDAMAVFADVGYQVTDRLKLTAGARWTDEDKDFDFGYNFFGAPEAPGCAGTALEPPACDPNLDPMSRSDDDVLTRFVVEYAATDNANVYLQRSEGFKGGGFSAIALFSTAPIGTYGPEENETWEAGLKADWFDGTLRTNLAYFISDIEDIQQNSTENVTGGLEFPVENVGDAEIDGFEFEIYWSPFENFNTFLVGSLLDGEYGNLVDGAAASRAEQAFGVEAQTPQTPDYAYTIGFDYSFLFENAAFEGASFGMDYYKVDNYVSAATNDALNPGFETLNAHINVDIDDNWQLSLTGKNITDEFIVVSGSLGLGGFVTLPPREYLFTVNYRH